MSRRAFRKTWRAARGIALFAVLSHARAGSDSPASADPVDGPRIGLVLSGGGALGLAHVGVLQVLEEYRVPVDFVAGTSMGAIIGGLYASGVSMDRLEAILAGADWWNMLRDHPPRRTLEFRSKQDTFRYIPGAEFGYRPPLRIVLPTGLAAGQNLDILLRRLCRPASGAKDFDALPIPFRAVAADLVSGDMVVLDGGGLADALRASMAVPGAFSPVRRNGRLLADGGLVNNLPVDVARAMGADRVLAVDVGSRRLEALREDLDTLDGVVARSYTLFLRQSMDEHLDDADLAILPDLRGYSPTEFHRAAEFIALGRRAAREQADPLRAWSVDAEAYRAYRERFHDLPPSDLSTVREVRIEGARRLPEHAIRKRLRVRPGDPVDPAAIEQDVARIYRLGEFQRVGYHLDAVDGDTDLVFIVHEKFWGPDYVRFGLHLDTDFVGDSAWQLRLLYTRTGHRTWGTEWRAELDAGTHQRIAAACTQPLSPAGPFFVGARVEGETWVQPLFEDDRKAATYDTVTGTADLELGLALSTHGELRAGTRYGAVRARLDTGLRDVEDYEGQLGGWTAGVAIDRLDHPHFARRGGLLRADFLLARRAMGSTDDYEAVQLDAREYISAGRHTAFLRFAAASSLGSELPRHAYFTLGGTDTIAALPTAQRAGNYALLAQAGYRVELIQLPPMLGRGLHLLVRGDVGNAWRRAEAISTGDLRASLAVALAADTAIGPLTLGVAASACGEQRAVLALGVP